MDQWAAIAKNYSIERDDVSLPALLIDKQMIALADRRVTIEGV
jgi:hypothetical protein